MITNVKHNSAEFLEQFLVLVISINLSNAEATFA